MATLLTTRKMSPELAARVEASVRGRRAPPGARIAPRSVSLIRLGLFAMFGVGASWLALFWHQAREHLERERSMLLQRVEREAASLNEDDHANLGRVRSWLQRSSSGYPGDFIAEEVGTPDGFTATIARPTIYVRGKVAGFKTAAGIEQTASASAIDAFVSCLMDPPRSRTEKALLARARTTYAAAERMRQATLHVQRLHHALVGLPFLAADWKARVVAADDQRSLDKLRRYFERAPIEAAKRAAKARLLLVAMDEPADTTAVAELDGERAHVIRVKLVDLAIDKLLLQLRRRVDPSWLSDGARAEYASGIDSCALALDVHDAVNGIVASSGR
jgi:hypothetical protein